MVVTSDVEVVLMSSDGELAIAMTITATVARETRTFVVLDVARRSHRPTRPIGRQNSKPGMIAHHVCHHGSRPLRLALVAQELSGVVTAGSACRGCV